MNDWESSSDYTDIQITGGTNFDLNSSFVSETSVQMGEMPSIKPSGSVQSSTNLHAFQEGESDEENEDGGFGRIQETDEEHSKRDSEHKKENPVSFATVPKEPKVYVENSKFFLLPFPS